MKERTGTLSYQAIGAPHLGQRLRGVRMLWRLGTRAITTLRKLPTMAPTANTQRVNATGRARARSRIYDVAAFPRARVTNSSSSERRWGVSEITVAPALTAVESAARACPSSVKVKTVARSRSEEHTSELQSRQYLVCRLLLEKKK